MRPWYFSIPGLVVTGIYLFVAIFCVTADRSDTPSGSWINLSGMLSFIITMPISAPLEALGFRPNFRSNVEIGSAILGCAMLIYIICLGAGALWRLAR